MLRHYVRTALRSLLRKKLYVFINVFGLAIGLALCLIIIGHISYELSFDAFHRNRDRIYRVEGDFSFEDEAFSSARVMAPLGSALVDELPEVKNAAVFRVGQIKSVTVGEERFRIEDPHEGHGYAHGRKLVFADPGYFEVFTFPVLQGNTETALSEPFSVFVTEQAAEEYFPDRDAMGQVIRINDQFDCRITGILENIPQNTQLYCDFVVSYATLERIDEDTQSWNTFDADYTYLLLDERADAAAVQAKIPSVVGKYLAAEEAGKYSFRLKPLKDIFFSVYGSGNRGELHPAGEASFLYTAGAIALFILLLAVANFLNLSTARSADRMKEVGMRKVLGAHRAQLVRQYLGESIIMALAAMLISVALYEAFKLNVRVLPREMLVDFYNDPILLICSILLVIVVGAGAGLYPAFLLSRIRSVSVLQGTPGIRSARSKLRKSLVVFQFTVATVFVFSTTGLIRQVNYLSTVDLGFDTENILLLDFDGERAADDLQLVKNDLTSLATVVSATASNCPPGRASYRYRGFYTHEDRREEDRVVTKYYEVDNDFLSTFGLEITRGRSFSEDFPSDAGNAIIISESGVEALGMDNPIGAYLYRGDDSFYEVVGVVKDFHGTTLDFGFKSISVIRLDPDECTSLAIKLAPGNLPGSIGAVRQVWESRVPGVAFKYTFLDDEIDSNYNSLRQEGSMFLWLAVFAIGIACLGIFGLVSYTAERRTKEIGIRKVMGASVSRIVAMLVKEFVLLIVIANAIGLPVAYLLVNDFLSWYPFRVSIGIGSYAFVLAVAVCFAMFTAGFQSIKAGLANPVDSLRRE